jgi:tripartite-type tricarboxylate transporter receptor subunit TctC
MKRHLNWFAAIALCLAVAAQAAETPSYPTRPITIISTSPPGGPIDVIARPIAQRLGERLGQSVLIESHAGANGAIASADVAKAPPDGYTLLVTYLAPVAISPAMRSDLPYDSVRDFAPVTQLDSAALVVLVRPDLPIHSIAELIEYAKAHSRRLTFGTVGPGSAGHLAGTLLAEQTGITLTHVPYKGGGPVITDLLGGHIDMALIGLSGGTSYVKEGRLRAIGVTTLERSSLLPEVPAVAETLPGFEMDSWYGILAPAHTPAPIVQKLQRTIAEILQEPAIEKLLKNNGVEPKGSTPEAFGAKIKEELARWAPVVKKAGLADK